MLVAISTQGGESIFSNLITPTHYGGQKQFTTESIILDKNLVAVSEAGAMQKTSCYLELPSSILDLWSLLPCLMYLYGVCV